MLKTLSAIVGGATPTEHEYRIITQALRVSAQQFLKDAAAVRPTSQRLADQFKRQADDAIALAEKWEARADGEVEP